MQVEDRRTPVSGRNPNIFWWVSESLSLLDAFTLSQPRPAKRRKEYDEPLVGDILWRMLSIRLCQAVSETLGLASPVFLKVENVDFITFNASKCSYLYFLCSLLFSVSQRDMTLYNSQMDHRLDDDDTSWEVCESRDDIRHGQYLVVFENGTGQLSVIHSTNFVVPSLEPVTVNKRRPGKAKNVPDADDNILASPTPKPSTMGPPPHHRPLSPTDPRHHLHHP